MDGAVERRCPLAHRCAACPARHCHGMPEPNGALPAPHPEHRLLPAQGLTCTEGRRPRAGCCRHCSTRRTAPRSTCAAGRQAGRGVRECQQSRRGWSIAGRKLRNLSPLAARVGRLLSLARAASPPAGSQDPPAHASRAREMHRRRGERALGCPPPPPAPPPPPPRPAPHRSMMSMAEKLDTLLPTNWWELRPR